MASSKLILSLALFATSATADLTKLTASIRENKVYSATAPGAARPGGKTKIRLEVEVTQDSSEPRTATWRVQVAKWELGANLATSDTSNAITNLAGGCPAGSQLNWHIHARAVNSPGGDAIEAGCQATDTGGHYDPTFACGGASEYAGATCDSIGRPAGNYSCAVNDYPSIFTCEVGDLSGKLGKVQTDTHESQYFYDTLADDISNYVGRSVVFHCCGVKSADSTDANGDPSTGSSCGPRVACADLVSA
jgi:hypothetical protein